MFLEENKCAYCGEQIAGKAVTNLSGDGFCCEECKEEYWQIENEKKEKLED